MVIVLVCQACSEVIDLPIDTDQQLVVECYLNPADELISLSLYNNRIVGQPNPGQSVEDASVFIEKEETGALLNLVFNEASDSYEARPAPGYLESGATYHLSVQFASMELNASTTIPEPIENFDLDLQVIPISFANDYFGNVQWDRPPSSEITYHRLSVNVISARNGRILFPALATTAFDADYLSLEPDAAMVSFPTIDFQEDNDPNSFGKLSFAGDTVKIRALNIDRNYYEFQLDLRKLQRADDLSDPLILFSNIKNGLGIFGSFTQVQTEFVLE